MCVWCVCVTVCGVCVHDECVGVKVCVRAWCVSVGMHMYILNWEWSRLFASRAQQYRWPCI